MQTPVDDHSEEDERKSSEESQREFLSEDIDDKPAGSLQNQLVVYDPGDSGAGLEIEQIPDPSAQGIPSLRKFPPRRPPKSMQSIGAFTVQCSRCLQWRLIPTRAKYEEIRENILEEPFYCEMAQEWRPDVTCADEPDISQDGSRVWAIDIPNIAKPPSGWERLLRIRGEGSTKFADVYYVAPNGKRLRSMIEVQKHLLEHPEYVSQGVRMSQFSFQTPKPLQENYLRKRPRLMANPSGDTHLRLAGSEAKEVNPLAWASPAPSTDLQLGMSGPSRSLCDPSSFGYRDEEPPSKKRYSNQTRSTAVFDESSIDLEDPVGGTNSPPTT